MLGIATRSLPRVSRAANAGRSADPRHELLLDKREPRATEHRLALPPTGRCADRIRSRVPVGRSGRTGPVSHRPSPPSACRTGAMRGGDADMVMVGDRGMISQKAIDETQASDGIGWITALKSVSIRALIEQ